MMASTPPLQSTIHTPATPLYGARHDSYQPYATRKSTRHSTQRTQRATQTPPPQSSDSESRFLSASISKLGSTVQQVPETYSPPSSTHTSPQMRQFENRNSKILKDISAAKDLFLPIDSGRLDHFQGSNISLPLDQPPIITSANMLPTPAKTPRKKPIPASTIVPTARVLFSIQSETVEEVIPIPRKRGRKRRNVGFATESFMGDDGSYSEDNIQIFTDSKEKVPELDPNEDNPFYDNSSHANLYKNPPNVKTDRKRKARASVSENKDVEEAFKREEGMVYVFRGKKIYRKFADDSDPEMQSSSSLIMGNTEGNAEPSTRSYPLTRSSIKPRLLFPSNTQRHERSCSNKEDEEAVTDIEEPLSLPNDNEMTNLAPHTKEETLVTPVKTFFTTPVTPPMTGYATRAVTKKALDYSSPTGPEPVESLGFQRKLGEKPCLFQGWQQPRIVRKRGNEVSEKEKGGSKRIKENIS